MSRQRVGHTLQPTALMNEAWIKVGSQQERWKDREHFLRAAARAMRQVLVDHARARATSKRTPNGIQIPLQDVICNPGEHAHEVLCLEEAIEELSSMDEELGQIIDLRYFAGLTMEETASAVGLSSRSVERRWRTARGWLADRLAPQP